MQGHPTSLPLLQCDRVHLPLDPPVIDMESESAAATSTKNDLEPHQSEEGQPIDNDGGYQKNEHEVVALEDAANNIDTLSLAAAIPEDVHYAQAAFLPCMDCELVGSHNSAC